MLLYFPLNECDYFFRQIQHAIEVRLRSGERWFELQNVGPEAAEGAA